VSWLILLEALMAADLLALRRAADLLDDWAKEVGYTGMINETDPNADRGIKLFAITIISLASRARAEAADLRMRALLAEADNATQAPGKEGAEK
jgi:hypothetical protein